MQNHPVQKTIFKQITKLTGNNKQPYGVDGCSAPTPFLSLRDTAKLFLTLGLKKFPELNKAYKAMTAHPYLVAGQNRFDTDFITTMRGRGITKVGGEAIRGTVIKTDKYGVVGIAQKTIDGGMRTSDIAIMTILNHLNQLTPKEKTQLIMYEKKKLFNHSKKQIGNIEATLN